MAQTDASCLYLQPFTESEKEGVKGQFLQQWLGGKLESKLSSSRVPSASELPERLMAGGFPDAFQRSPARARRWQSEYVSSIIERDIHDIADVRNARDVSRLLCFLAEQTASLLNVSTTANALGHTRRTVENHLGVLEKLFLLRRLPAWHSNRNKRLVKTPKIHLCDSGIAAVLSDLRPEQWNTARQRFGHLLESCVVQQVIALGACLEQAPRFYHYRDKDQVEVDLVMEIGSDIWGIEVKAAASIQTSDGKGLRRLADSAGTRFRGGVVFYDGKAMLPIDKGRHIQAVPLARLWEL